MKHTRRLDIGFHSRRLERSARYFKRLPHVHIALYDWRSRQVLYRELGLPLNGDPSLQNQNALTRSKSRRQSKLSPSSSKDVLIKLKALHPLPGIILEWRKLNMAITKVRCDVRFYLHAQRSGFSYSGCVSHATFSASSPLAWDGSHLHKVSDLDRNRQNRSTRAKHPKYS